jgi:hypothetical protein
VIGITATGRALIHVLNLDQAGVVNLRKLLIMAGLHPPDDNRADEKSKNSDGNDF